MTSRRALSASFAAPGYWVKLVPKSMVFLKALSDFSSSPLFQKTYASLYRSEVATRAVGQLRGARVLGEVGAEVDGLLEGVERLLELTLVPEDVRELVQIGSRDARCRPASRRPGTG